MTLQTLFGTEVTGPQKVQFKQIKAVYEILYISEEVIGYLQPGQRYTAPQEAGEIMGIKVLDHIIIGQDEYLSFTERGLL